MSYCKIDLIKALDWQRSNADNFKKLIQDKQAWYQSNVCDQFTNWFNDVFNLDTANDFGLSVWAIILDVRIFGENEDIDLDYDAWGFDQNENFSNGNFFPEGASYNYTTEEKRILLKLKAYICHMGGSVSGGSTSINNSLYRIFSGDKITCIDNRDMSFTYLVNDPALSDFVIELYNNDLLPRPEGIEISLVLDAAENSWGFGDAHENFSNGNFYNGLIIGA